MMKTIFKRVMWLARGTSMVLGLAVMLALVFGMTTMALAAVPGDPFKLGKANTIDRLSKLVGSVDAPMLRIDNNNAGTNATALDLQVESGKAPMTVNPEAGTATNLSADKLDGKNENAFQSANAAAGGDLTGTFPNPAIANDAVNSAKVANGSLVLADLQGVGTSVGGTFVFTVPANGCEAPFDAGIATASPFQVGDLVVWKVTEGFLPTGLYMPAVSVTKADRIPQLFCNGTTSDISVNESYVFGVRAVR